MIKVTNKEKYVRDKFWQASVAPIIMFVISTSYLLYAFARWMLGLSAPDSYDNIVAAAIFSAICPIIVLIFRFIMHIVLNLISKEL